MHGSKTRPAGAGPASAKGTWTDRATTETTRAAGVSRQPMRTANERGTDECIVCPCTRSGMRRTRGYQYRYSPLHTHSPSAGPMTSRPRSLVESVTKIRVDHLPLLLDMGQPSTVTSPRRQVMRTALVLHRSPCWAQGWLSASPCLVLGLQNACRVAHP